MMVASLMLTVTTDHVEGGHDCEQRHNSCIASVGSHNRVCSNKAEGDEVEEHNPPVELQRIHVVTMGLCFPLARKILADQPRGMRDNLSL